MPPSSPNPQFLHRDDPLTLEFDTEIRERIILPDGRAGLILNRTYFYPTGGGQAHDTGTLGAARVVDVLKSDDGAAVIHVVEGEPGEGTLHAVIDAERRIRHMQHHTAQHLLSATFWRTLHLETLSSAIHGWTPSHIDLPDVTLSAADLRRVEDEANRVIFENRRVRTFTVPDAQAAELSLRRPPKVRGDIRIVEIEGTDRVACGGTHCPQTGMIGTLKILRTERINHKLRVHFVAGWQALETLRGFQEIAQSLAGMFSAAPAEVTELVEKQRDQLQTAERELRRLRAAQSACEARGLAESARRVGNLRLIAHLYESRPAGELRALADALKEQPDLVGLLATFDGQKLVLIATCGTETGLSARELLNERLARLGGRGGGDDQIAQGGGRATPEQAAALFDGVEAALEQRK